jgi:hypothetical protein
MVKDRVWNAAGMEPWGGCLCIGCLETRLGRRLRRQDFKAVTINHRNYPDHSPRLLSRLMGPPQRRDSSCRIENIPQNKPVDSGGYTPQKPADSIGGPLVRSRGLVATQIPPELMEAVLRAEIGEPGVARNLRDRPPRRLLAKLDASTGNFAPAAKDGYPRRIKWRHACGPKLSPAQLTDYIENEEDLRLRNPRQPEIREIATRDVSNIDAVPSDWRPVSPAQPILDDLSIPKFLQRLAAPDEKAAA